MRLFIAVIMLLSSTAYAADQETLDFCHKYIGEAIKPKVTEPKPVTDWIKVPDKRNIQFIIYSSNPLPSARLY